MRKEIAAAGRNGGNLNSGIGNSVNDKAASSALSLSNRKSSKYPSAPRPRAVSAYVMFAQDWFRKHTSSTSGFGSALSTSTTSMSASGADSKQPRKTAAAAVAWKALDNTEREFWTRKWAADRDRFSREWAAWMKTKEYESWQNEREELKKRMKVVISEYVQRARIIKALEKKRGVMLGRKYRRDKRTQNDGDGNGNEGKKKSSGKSSSKKVDFRRLDRKRRLRDTTLADFKFMNEIITKDSDEANEEGTDNVCLVLQRKHLKTGRKAGKAKQVNDNESEATFGADSLGGFGSSSSSSNPMQQKPVTKKSLVKSKASAKTKAKAKASAAKKLNSTGVSSSTLDLPGLQNLTSLQGGTQSLLQTAMGLDAGTSGGAFGGIGSAIGSTNGPGNGRSSNFLGSYTGGLALGNGSTSNASGTGGMLALHDEDTNLAAVCDAELGEESDEDSDAVENHGNDIELEEDNYDNLFGTTDELGENSKTKSASKKATAKNRAMKAKASAKAASSKSKTKQSGKSDKKLQSATQVASLLNIQRNAGRQKFRFKNVMEVQRKLVASKRKAEESELRSRELQLIGLFLNAGRGYNRVSLFEWFRVTDLKLNIRERNVDDKIMGKNGSNTGAGGLKLGGKLNSKIALGKGSLKGRNDDKGSKSKSADVDMDIDGMDDSDLDTLADSDSESDDSDNNRNENLDSRNNNSDSDSADSDSDSASDGSASSASDDIHMNTDDSDSDSSEEEDSQNSESDLQSGSDDSEISDSENSDDSDDGSDGATMGGSSAGELSDDGVGVVGGKQSAADGRGKRSYFAGGGLGSSGFGGSSSSNIFGNNQGSSSSSSNANNNASSNAANLATQGKNKRRNLSFDSPDSSPDSLSETLSNLSLDGSAKRDHDGLGGGRFAVAGAAMNNNSNLNSPLGGAGGAARLNSPTMKRRKVG